ncbi:hypothetical protein B0H14DRAFT_2617111 [Mycena olivaceomarginata]|nr:hypothetical protein B0H14DRAFT_2617102 [Mycena olivaceomarginata]KAJ7799323.1 hypothetical protein B0H14DRAFT_2617111 [Mycena olivaceomarginata]
MLSSAVITRSWPSLNIWRYRAPTDDGEVYTNKHSFTPNDIDIGRDPNLILDCHARATKNSRSLRDQKTSTQPARWTRVRDVREIASAVDSKSGIEVSPEQLAILVMQFIAGCISALDGSVDAEALQGWENEEANSPQTLSKQGFAGQSGVAIYQTVSEPETIAQLATEFFAQIRDHGLAQVVWGHGRVIRPQEALLNRSFIAIEKCVSLPGGGELVYDVVQPYGTGWLSLFHWLQLTRYYNFLHRPTDDFRNLITFLRPSVEDGNQARPAKNDVPTRSDVLALALGQKAMAFWHGFGFLWLWLEVALAWPGIHQG